MKTLSLIWMLFESIQMELLDLLISFNNSGFEGKSLKGVSLNYGCHKFFDFV